MKVTLSIALFLSLFYHAHAQGFVLTPSVSNAVCQNDTIHFNISSNPPGSFTYQWNITDLFGTVVGVGTSPNVFATLRGKLSTYPNFINIKIEMYSGVSKIKDTTISSLVRISPVVALGSDKTICPGSFASLFNLSSPGTSTYVNLWRYQSTTFAGASIDVSSTGTYSLTVIDNVLPNCKTTQFINVSSFAKPSVVISGSSVRCAGKNLQLFSNIVSESTPPYTYLWKPFTNINNITAQNPVVFPNSPITYKVIATDANGCKDSSSVNVTLNPALNLSIMQNDTSLCKFNVLTINASMTGGTFPYTYKWSPATGVSDTTITNPAISPTEFAGILYTLTGIDANNCEASDMILIKKHSLQFSFKNYSEAVSTCTGSVLQIASNTSGGFAPYSYTWNPVDLLDKINDSTYKTKPLTSNVTIKASVLDGNGCTDADSLKITINTLPLPNTVGEKFVCKGFNTTVNVASISSGQVPADLTYLWRPSADIANPNSSLQTITAQQEEISKFYVVTVTNIVTKCVASDSVKVTTKLSPVMNINIPQETLYRSSEATPKKYTFAATASPPGIITYRWVLSDSVLSSTKENVEIAFNLAKKYTISVAGTNEFGCTGIAAQDLMVKLPSSKKIVIPTVFSPNAADERNKKWYIFGQIDDFSKNEFSVKVFNILGQVVYESANIENTLFAAGRNDIGWDASEYNVGVYTYVLKGKWADDESFSYKGSITLLK